MKNMPLAFGADATRRMNLEAIALGFRGIPVRERSGVGEGIYDVEVCKGWACVPLPRGEPVLFERAILCFSDLIWGRALAGVPVDESVPTDGTGRLWWAIAGAKTRWGEDTKRLRESGGLESVDWVVEEL